MDKPLVEAMLANSSNGLEALSKPLTCMSEMSSDEKRCD